MGRGFRPENINVQTSDGALTITAERLGDAQSVICMTRIVRLPSDVDARTVKAFISDAGDVTLVAQRRNVSGNAKRKPKRRLTLHAPRLNTLAEEVMVLTEMEAAPADLTCEALTEEEEWAQSNIGETSTQSNTVKDTREETSAHTNADEAQENSPSDDLAVSDREATKGQTDDDKIAACDEPSKNVTQTRHEKLCKELDYDASQPWSIELNLEGFDPEEVTVKVKRCHVTVFAEQGEDNGSRHTRTMRHAFLLPRHVMTEQMTSYLNEAGVLRISAPYSRTLTS